VTLPLTASTTSYEARYGWRTRDVVTVLVSLALIAFGILAPAGSHLSLVLRLFICVVGLFLTALTALIAFSGKVALRADDAGVLLGGSPLRYDAYTALVPWSDIVGVELWVQRVSPWKKLYWVGLHRVPGAPALPGSGSPRAAKASAWLADKSPELLLASRSVSMWKLDGRAFLDAVQQLAPHVRIQVEPGFKL
jgi:hypothetical protein